MKCMRLRVSKVGQVNQWKIIIQLDLSSHERKFATDFLHISEFLVGNSTKWHRWSRMNKKWGHGWGIGITTGGLPFEAGVWQAEHGTLWIIWLVWKIYCWYGQDDLNIGASKHHHIPILAHNLLVDYVDLSVNLLLSCNCLWETSGCSQVSCKHIVSHWCASSYDLVIQSIN